jgi:hypothetical protein
MIPDPEDVRLAANLARVGGFWLGLRGVIYLSRKARRQKPLWTQTGFAAMLDQLALLALGPILSLLLSSVIDLGEDALYITGAAFGVAAIGVYQYLARRRSQEQAPSQGCDKPAAPTAPKGQ